MNGFAILTRRILNLFFHNKANLLLTFFSILIVICLYTLFLRNFMIEMVTMAVGSINPVEEFTDRHMFAGLLVVINTTTCFGILQICVNDIAKGIWSDFFSAPVSPFAILSGYWFSGTLVSFLFTALTSAALELYFQHAYGSVLSVNSMSRTACILFFCSLLNTGLLLCIATRLKDTASFSTFGNLYGILIGFLTGAYLPYSFYPSWLRAILSYFPPTHLTGILRQEYAKMTCPALTLQAGPQVTDRLYLDFGVRLEKSAAKQWSFLVFFLALLLFYHWWHSLRQNERSL